MTYRIGSEGSPHSKIVQLMRNQGYSKPVNIELATVTSAPPNLKIRLDSDGLELEKEDLIVLEHLTRHDRIVSVSYEYPKTWSESADIGDADKNTSSSRMEIGGPTETPYESYEMKYAKMTYEDLLLRGDRVVVACLDEDMVYVVLDRAVWYS